MLTINELRDLDTVDFELRLLAALSASTVASRQVVTSTSCSTSATS